MPSSEPSPTPTNQCPDERESIEWGEEKHRFVEDVKDLRHSEARLDKLNEIGQNAGRLWTAFRREEEKKAEARRREGLTKQQVALAGVGVLLLILAAIYLIQYECDEDCQVANAERTAIAEMEQARTTCQGDFTDWREVEQTIRNATQYPATFEWADSFLGQVSHLAFCATDSKPYHAYQAQFDLSNPFGVTERHQVAVHVYPEDGLYEIYAFNERIGIGLLDS